MANKIYPKWKVAIMQATANSALTGNVKVSLIDLADYTYSDNDEFYDPAISGAGKVVASSGNLTTKTYGTASQNAFDADNITFTAVTGDPCEAIIIWVDTATPTTSRLVAFLDTGITGLPVTPNGGNINLNWDATGIFAL
jgi:hypothetical protein